MEQFPPPPNVPQPTAKPAGMSRDFRNTIIQRLGDLVADGTDDHLQDAKCQVLHALLDLFSAGDQSEKKLGLVQRFVRQFAESTDLLQDEKLETMDAVLTSFRDPNMNEAHLKEIKAIHEAPSQPIEREGIALANHISFLDNISARRTILEQIQEAEYPTEIPITHHTAFVKLKRECFSKVVWAAFWVTPFNQLQDFSLKISRQEITYNHMRRSLNWIMDDLPRVMEIVNNRKYENPNTPRVQASPSSLRTATPGLSSRPSLVSADAPQELSLGLPAMDFQNQPESPQNPLGPSSPASGKGSVAPTKSTLSRNPLGPTTPTKIQKRGTMSGSPRGGSRGSTRDSPGGPSTKSPSLNPPRSVTSRDIAHERDNYKCCALGTEHNQVAHAFPQNKIEHAGDCAQMIQCLAFLFGEQKVQEYADALTSGYLDSPANLITLDEGIHTRWDQCKVTLRVESFDANEVDFGFYYLKDSKLRTRSRTPARYIWQNDLTANPEEILCEFVHKPSAGSREKTLGRPADMHFVSNTTTQHRIHDGFKFKVYAKDPALRPDPVLFDLRDKLIVMACLTGAAEPSEDEEGDDEEGTKQPAFDEAEDYLDSDEDMSEESDTEEDHMEYDSD